MKIGERISKISELDYLKVARRMRIAAQIEDAMKAMNLSKKDLALLMDRRPSEITKWLSGNQNFTSDTLAELSYYLKAKITGEKTETIARYMGVYYSISTVLVFPETSISRPISARSAGWAPVTILNSN